MEWISVKDHLPTEEKQYLVTRNCFGYKVMTVANWSNDLCKLNELDFYYMNDMDDKSGFWDSDPEWGMYQIDNVLAWCEIEPYKGE